MSSTIVPPLAVAASRAASRFGTVMKTRTVVPVLLPRAPIAPPVRSSVENSS
jgi:hypothetical protein